MGALEPTCTSTAHLVESFFLGQREPNQPFHCPGLTGMSFSISKFE